MPVTLFGILVTASGVGFSVLGAHALAMRRSKDYAGSWGAFAWAFAPGAISALVLTTDGNMTVGTRNIVVGILGGAIGACLAVYLGYMISDWRASVRTPPKGGESMSGDDKPNSLLGGPSPAFNVTGSGNIITNNQTGGQNTINQAPRPSVKEIGHTRTDDGSGGCTDTITFRVVYPGVLPNITVVARAPDITALTVNPASDPDSPNKLVSGTKSNARWGYGSGFFVYSFGNVNGWYQAVVTKSGKAPTTLEYRFE